MLIFDKKNWFRIKYAGIMFPLATSKTFSVEYPIEHEWSIVIYQLSTLRKGQMSCGSYRFHFHSGGHWTQFNCNPMGYVACYYILFYCLFKYIFHIPIIENLKKIIWCQYLKDMCRYIPYIELDVPDLLFHWQ
jgi:hypothetical protein